jgi:hypothetical protein
VRSQWGAPFTLDLPTQRGLDRLASDPQLAEAVLLLRRLAAEAAPDASPVP